ncbi:MAG: carbon-nitrogen hydrolase [Planctomycetes bacterium]|nr:carbon-nitrogen hydrolase [Planctomycetota bacterium]
MDCRVTLLQTNPTLGNLAANLRDHVERIHAAIAAGSQLVVFPELSLTGYFLKDQTVDLALPIGAKELQELAALSKDISIVVGFVERSKDGRIYNATAFLEDGKVLAVHRKVHLVTYGMFDEQREFAAGEEFRPIDSKLGRFGILICEDAWHVSSGYLHFLHNVDVMLVPSNSPGRGVGGGGPELESRRTWNTLVEAHGRFFQTWIVYVNRVGWEDGVLFSGGTRVVDPFGEVAATLEGFDIGSLQCRLDSNTLERARVVTPLRRDAKPWILAEGLARDLSKDQDA